MAPANMPFSSINIEAAVIDDGAEGYADDKLPAAGEADGVVDGSDGEEESCGVEVSDGEGESEPRDYGALLLAREAEEEGNRTRLALEEQTSLIDLFTRYAELLGTQDAPDRDAMSKLYRLAQPLRTQLELMEKAVVDEHEGRSIAQRVLRKMAKVKGFNALAALTKGYGEKWLGLK
ncbi:hypothetical protein L198_06608 [Cryptococcus wingfieldii CBS 7118]|uniref:Uncharacterized protein n=1 Tax=Cryptococcus wingfieldii CBS 7118 TaxID=1295528 RepID=A0A1E3ILI6_9TREE|nr:hypothetical protein L198_06608 [Cryptococcus wingfieldii CBS 7118]ODN88806.1 hypothetical protein L198_06608 [Cryptococcus wingfieldii CBS 7118]